MKLKKLTKVLVVAGLVFSSSAFAKTVIKIGHFNSDMHPSNIVLNEVFKKTVEEKRKVAMKFVFSQIINWAAKIKS